MEGLRSPLEKQKYPYGEEEEMPKSMQELWNVIVLGRERNHHLKVLLLVTAKWKVKITSNW